MEITSLLFDLNYKFELIGASLLALAKSVYYVSETSFYITLFLSAMLLLWQPAMVIKF